MIGKFYGKIGFAQTSEISPGVWRSIIEEKTYYGDILNETTINYEALDKVNSDMSLRSSIKIVADKYILENFRSAKYVEFMGAKWRVESVSIRYPTITLSIGGAYNET